MKVCIVTSVYPRSHTDLEVPWFREVVRRCHERGADVQVYAPSFRGLRTHCIDGVTVHRFRYFPARWETLTHEEGAPNKIHRFHYKLMTIGYLVLGTVGLVRLHLRERFGLFHVHWPFPHALFAFTARRFAPASVVLNFYGASLLLVHRYPFVRWFLNGFIRRADACVAISSYTAARVRAIRECRVTIIPYGAAVAQPSIPPRFSPLILTVGRMIERKGFVYAIRALELVVRDVPDATLCMVGDGPVRRNLAECARECGVTQRVELPGKVSAARLEELYASCGAFVLPSVIDSRGDTEGLGVVLMEALMWRKPVVASNVGGIVDIVSDEETGLLVPPADPVALAGALVRVLTDSALAHRLGEEGYRHIRKTFDWEVITAQVLQLYDSPRA